MASSRRTGGQGLTLGVPSETSERLGRVPRSFEERPVHVPDLTGDDAKASGMVRLPLHLSWIGEDYAYDLTDRNDRPLLYERVLVERTEADIIFYVDLALPVDVWDEMVLPAHVREAWQSTVDPQRRQRRPSST